MWQGAFQHQVLMLLSPSVILGTILRLGSSLIFNLDNASNSDEDFS